MDKTSRKILKYITDPKYNSRGHMLFSEFYSDYPDYNATNDHKIMTAIRYLESKGYIKFIAGISNNVGFELEHKAYHPWAFARDAVISFLFHSIAVPITVAFITAIITAWVTVKISG